MGYTDNDIINAIRVGNDRDALKFLYNSLFPRVERFIRNNSGDSDAAFDVFQDSIVVFYKYVKLNKFDQKYEIGAFVFAVSKNLWFNRLQKVKREVVLSPTEDYPDNSIDIPGQIMTREREEAVSDALSQLGQRCEQLLRFSVFYRLKNNEICEKMGFRTENAVKTRKYKCMQKLIALIEANPSLKVVLEGI
jgi:RNA polymerase sigma factor (sigma-70 family)